MFARAQCAFEQELEVYRTLLVISTLLLGFAVSFVLPWTTSGSAVMLLLCIQHVVYELGLSAAPQAAVDHNLWPIAMTTPGAHGPSAPVIRGIHE